MGFAQTPFSKGGDQGGEGEAKEKRMTNAKILNYEYWRVNEPASYFR
jgi:hypothetical protein